MLPQLLDFFLLGEIMKNQIRTADLILYFQERQKQMREKHIARQALHDAAELKYNKTIWHRWFGCTYADSIHYSEDALQFRFYKIWEREAGEILAQLTYRTKCGYYTTFWEWGDWEASHFYTWCAKNNIPY